MSDQYKIPSNTTIQAIQKDLIQWYSQVKRDLPWRRRSHPYDIWISEVMLQQTRVETVIDYYNRFMDWFPTVEDLAEADEDKLMKAWEGLGYYSRARNLQRAARIIVYELGGHFPTSVKGLLKLPGIGPYTSGAIASIAMGIPAAAVDGNVLRVYSRLFQIPDPINKAPVKKKYEHLGQALVSHEDPSSYNQGLMELGATVCTPKSPKCLICPVQAHCQSFHQGDPASLPVKEKKKKQKQVQLLTLWLTKDQDHLLVKRPASGLLAGLWSLPAVEEDPNMTHSEALAQYLQEELGLETASPTFVGKAKHVFTHVVWHHHVYRAEWKKGDLPAYPECRWVHPKGREDLAIPTAFLKAVDLING